QKNRDKTLRGSIAPSLRQIAVCVNPPIAQERPVAAYIFRPSRVAFGDQYPLILMRSLGDQHTERIADERRPPKFEAGFLWSLVAGAIDGGDIDAVGDGVGALDGLPRGMLGDAELGFLA